MSSDGADRLVRPYLITGGRTQPVDELPLEALVEATEGADAHLPSMRFERQRVLELCTSPISVAEVAANLGIPLGVARVLLSDLSSAGLVRVHATASTDGPDVHLLERLLDGLRSC